MDSKWRDRLRHAIDESDYTTTSASIAAGLNRGYLGRLLSTDQSPRLDALSRVCDLLEVPITYILTGESFSEDTAKIVEVYLQLPPEARPAALQLLEFAAAPRGDANAEEENP